MAKENTLDSKTAVESKKSGAAKAAKGGGKAAKPSLPARMMQYFRDVRAEMKRVVWPGGKEVRTSSLVVVVTLGFFIAFTLVVDNIVIYLIRLITELRPI